MASLAQPAQLIDVPLSLFGGMNTEVAPADLPEGLSPDNQDMAFVPGDTHSRACLKRLFATPFVGGVEAVYGKSYTLPSGNTLNLFLDSAGKIYVQDVGNSPTMYSFLAQLPAGVKAQSASAFGREYIAISDLIHGTWPPLQFDGTNLDRVTQDGPAVGPTVNNVIAAVATVANSGAGTVYNISTLTPSDPVVVTYFVVDPTTRQKEEVDITFYSTLTIVTTAPNALTVGLVTSIAGVTPSSFNRTNVKVVAIVDSVTFKIAYHSQSTATGTGGTATIQNPSLVRQNNVVTATTSAPHGFQQGWQAKIVMANLTIGGGIAAITRDGNGVVTVTLTTPVTIPIGATLQMIGITNPDNTFNGQFKAASVLSPTVFTYAQGGAPATSTAGTGNVQDVFSVTAFIQSIVDPLTFTYENVGPDDLTNSSGTATILGQISPGAHGVVISYLNRQGALSTPSPPVIFQANGAQQMILSNLPIGPANVVARLIGLTGAGGANYFVLPSTPQVAGVVTGTSTLIPDNTSTSAVLDFSDTTLFAGIAIDQPGNDLFDQRTLSPGLGFFSYGSRLMFWGDFNRVENLLNMTLSAQISLATFGMSATGGSTNGSGVAWTSPANVASNSAFASVLVSAIQSSQQLYAQVFNFSISAGAIAQLKLSFNYYYGLGSFVISRNATVQLLQAGVPFGTPYSLYLSPQGNQGSASAPLTASFTIANPGLTVADVNSGLFGFLITIPVGNTSAQLFVNNAIVQASASGAFPPGWSTATSTGGSGVVQASNLPGIYAVYKMTGAGGAGDAMITQPVAQDAFGTSIILPNTLYSFALYTAYATGITGLLVADLYSPTLGQLAFGSIDLSVATSAVAKFQRFTFNNPTPATIPSDTLLRVYLSLVLPTKVVSIAEMSLIYAAQPYNNILARTSYVLNPEGMAQTTGNIGSQDDGSAIRCFSIQRNGVLLKTAEGTHVFQQNDFEPSAWVVDNLSRSVGACSIRAGDPGRFGTGDAAEDWDITVNQNGWYIFAGGDFWRISPEISKGGRGALTAFNPAITWDDVDWSRQHLIWVKNDVPNRRTFCGAPIVGYDNLQLFVLDYRELDTASDIANAPALKIGLTGKELSTDKTRKWTRWNVSANMADTLILPGNAKSIVFAGAARNGAAYGNLYTLDPDRFTDDDYGPMAPYYTTYGFVNHDQEQQLGFGANRKLVRKISGYITGIGYVSVIPFVDSLWNPLPETSPRLLDRDTDASNLLDDDLEWTTGIRGDRIFFRIQVEPAPGTTDVQLKIQKLIIGMMRDAVATRRSSDL